MKALPGPIYRAAQVRELDRLAIDQHGIPGYTLMYRAGEAAFGLLRRRWPWARNLLVVCGAGNNAGDGYVLARLAQAKGLTIRVAALFDPATLRGDAAVARDTYVRAGGQFVPWSPQLLDEADVVVDAVLGTGLTRPVDGQTAETVRAINGAGRPVLALDIPTGLCADTGRILGVAVRAETTMTFVGLKLGLFIGEGPDCVGELAFDGLGIPVALARQIPCAAMRIGDPLVAEVLPARRRTAHKGDAGHVLLVGGGCGYAGAVRLAAEAALRAGAGLVTVATQPDHVSAIVAGRPEIMCRGVLQADQLAPLLAAADVIGVGPGLGRDDWARTMLAATLATDAPLVVDADGLNLLATDPVRRDNWIVTPHPGEAGRLLGIDTASVQADRPGAVAALVARYGGIAVLKGAGTLVAQSGDVPWICDRGNPGMAAPGMGDVLTGVIAAIAAQCGDLFDAARAGVLVHACAGDDAAALAGERGLVAGDLFPGIRRRVNPDK